MMLLTILELCIACDKAAVEQCPPMKRFPTEIPLDPWCSLMLKSATDMQRLAAAESYIHQRQEASCSSRSMLFDFGHPEAFGPQYYTTSCFHQSLRARITEHEQALAERRVKINQYARFKDRFDLISTNVLQLSCVGNQPEGTLCKTSKSTSTSAPTCAKCDLVRRANELGIEPIMWPLPQQDSEAQAIIFELRVPPFFGAWRDCMLFFLDTVLRSEPAKQRPKASSLQDRFGGSNGAAHYVVEAREVPTTRENLFKLVNTPASMIAIGLSSSQALFP